jgi:hypothetical protein
MQTIFHSGSEELMDSRSPDFYLISSEGYGLESPRRCWRLKPLRLATRDDLLLVMVEPPVIYRDRNGIELQLEQIVLAARHVGYSINLINEWPCRSMDFLTHLMSKRLPGLNSTQPRRQRKRVVDEPR